LEKVIIGIITGYIATFVLKSQQMIRQRMVLPKNVKSGILHYILAIAIIAGSASLCIPLANTENYHVVSYILLFVVSIISTFLGIGPVLLAATLSALVWNFLFIPPHWTFHIDKTEDILIFGLFFIIALVNGVLTTRVRRQEKVAREREKRTSALFELTKELSKASGMDEVLGVAIEKIRNHFSLSSFFILQDGNNTLNSSGRLQKEKKLSPAEYSVAEWVFIHSRKAGAFTSNPFAVDYTFYPLLGTRVNPGVVAVKTGEPFPDEQKSYWDTFLSQISNALEREFLGELAQKVRFLDESDRLYKTLFNSISHELRIPVATIMGASDSILNSSNPANMQSALCQEIFTASLRLNRLIENLLNISRLESGHISVRLDWCDVNDLFNKVTEDLKEDLRPFSLKVSIPEDMPMVKIDFGLMEQVLYNLLFNSTQYSPAASDIGLTAEYSDGELIITVKDRGPGLPESELKNVFKKFFRVDGSKTGGLGLGLSIGKGFVEAHNGQITVYNSDEGGAVFTIRIPSVKPDIENF
jgi:K+-sensing histidine kinase KdpD